VEVQAQREMLLVQQELPTQAVAVAVREVALWVLVVMAVAVS
jgi:hypothetical protein